MLCWCGRERTGTSLGGLGAFVWRRGENGGRTERQQE